MCHDLDSRPPIPPLGGAAVEHRDLVLDAADGNRLAAFEALPEKPSGACLAILPDVRGLHGFYEELTLRFAERGHRTIAIDYYGRTAGPQKRDESFDYQAHRGRVTDADVRTDLAAALEHLRAAQGGGCGAVFTVGFCFGGRHSWLAAAEQAGLAGAVGFYGLPGERDGRPGPTQRAGEIKAPILALMGGADQAVSAADIAAFEKALKGARIEHEVVTYEGAPHSFFDRKQEEFAEASEDAWRRTLEFIEHHGG
jgi:carboxymethylenebutenolidase